MRNKCRERSSARVFALGLLVLGLTAGGGSPADGQTAATPAAGFQGIWYEIAGGGGDYPNKYGGGLATYPQQIAPMAIYSEEVNRTYFAFGLDINLGPGRNIGHGLSYFDHNTGLVARPQIWLDKGTGDAHDAPVLALDDEGYIYMFSNTHGEARQSWIRRSDAPHSIGGYVDLLSPDSPSDMAVFGNPSNNPGMSGNPRFSYSSAWYVPNSTEEEKFLLLHTRYISGQRDLFTTSSIDADTWTERKTLSQIESGQYQTSWIKPNGKTVGTIFNVHPTGQGLDWRTDLYYLETSDQGQTWQTADGLTLVDNSGSNNNPLTIRPDQPIHGAAQVYDAAPGERVYLKDINYNGRGQPVIMFLTSPSHVPGDHGEPGPDRFLKTAQWNGSQWLIKDFRPTDHNYDYGAFHIEEDGTWRVIAPYIDGPQQYGTGGEIGMWTSRDQGTTWILEKQLTNDSPYNHTYVQRPLHAHEDFYGFWADGDAFEPSTVHFYFTNKNGDVFHLPYETDSDFVAPEPYVTRPIEFLPGISGKLDVNGNIESLRITTISTSREYAFDELKGAILSGFDGQVVTNPNGKIADIIMPTGTTTGPTPQERLHLLGDNRIDTAFVNMTGWKVQFAEEIVNQPGPDIVLLDWGSADTVSITIGDVTFDHVPPTSSGVFGASSSGVRFQSNERNVDSLENLLAATLARGPTTSGGQTVYAIDLSDYGFALGSVLAVGEEVIFTNGDGIDPTGIFGLPSTVLAGDFNLDGTVDAADYTVWRNGLGTKFRADDYLTWKAHFGESLPSEQASDQNGTLLAAVPEPATWIGLVVGIALVMRIMGGAMHKNGVQ